MRKKFTKQEKQDLKAWRKIAQERIDWSHRVCPKFTEDTRMKNLEYALAVVLISVCERLGIK